MKKQVDIQISDLGQEGVTEHAQGTYFLKGDVHYLFYEKKDPTTGAVLSQRVTIYPDRVELHREGQQPGKISLIPGQRTEHVMRFPYGNVTLACDHAKISVSHQEDGGHAHLEYEMYLNDGFVENHRVHISWKDLGEA